MSPEPSSHESAASLDPPGGVCRSVLEVIGHTPIVELARLTRGLEGRIVAKLEYLNPAGSKKDLVAFQIIAEAEADGLLRPGQTVVEVTSGNTGNGLALVCAVKGYPFVAVMSRGNSPERVWVSRAFGAEVVLVEQSPGSTPGHVTGDDLSRVEEAADRVVRERGAFRADQFHRDGQWRLLYDEFNRRMNAGESIDEVRPWYDQERVRINNDPSLDSNSPRARVLSDYGRLAAALGYDAILASPTVGWPISTIEYTATVQCRASVPTGAASACPHHDASPTRRTTYRPAACHSTIGCGPVLYHVSAGFTGVTAFVQPIALP